MLLTRVFDQTINEPLSQAMALGRLDGWLLEPWDPAEEYLYGPITEQLAAWIRSTGRPGFTAVDVVAEPRSARSHQINDLLSRNAIPYRFHARDSSAGRRILQKAGRDASDGPGSFSTDKCLSIRPTPTSQPL